MVDSRQGYCEVGQDGKGTSDAATSGAASDAGGAGGASVRRAVSVRADPVRDDQAHRFPPAADVGGGLVEPFQDLIDVAAGQERPDLVGAFLP